VESHDDVLVGDNFTAEKITFVAVERADLSIIEFHCVAIGPIDRPKTRLRVEQSHGEAFEWLSVQCRMKDVEIAPAHQKQTELLGRVEFLPLVAADPRLLQRAIPDVPVSHQEVEIVARRCCARCYRKAAVG
jgi:hypothetical protein